MAHGGLHGQVGQGGTGPDGDIPECPVCHAYGGGGHGGFCPNMNEPDPARWTTLPPAGFTAAPPHLREGQP